MGKPPSVDAYKGAVHLSFLAACQISDFSFRTISSRFKSSYILKEQAHSFLPLKHSLKLNTT